ncbi:MAG: hypothetical protein K0S27_1797 [Gammaproteobacteria bacterium]|jgi:hypothetical protein|nr:hypothetical protein [Gammaproteobacteria bacterium]
MRKEREKEYKEGRKEKENLITMTFQCPVSLKNSFKSKVSSEGKSVRHVLVYLMEKYVQDL